MGLSEIMILVMALVGFAAGYLGAVLRHGDTWVGTPSASHNTGMDSISQQYYELLYSVEQKWPNESRHQTALRYIQQAERNSKCGGVAKQHHT